MDSILGFVIALMLSMLNFVGLLVWSKTGLVNVQTAALASQSVIVNKAFAKYVEDNSVTLAAQATATVPVKVTTTNLAAATPSYLPAGFSSTNGFKQTWLMEVLQPTAGNLQALVTTQGGRPISNVQQLVQVAVQTGAQGGFVPYAGQNGDATMSASFAYGAMGTWGPVSLANFTNPGSGHLASLLAFGGAQTSNGYLYRVQVPGHPELNQMQTAIDMASNDINNAGKVTVNTSLTSNGDTFLTSTGTPNAACSVPMSIRRNANGTGLVICNGVWQPIGIAVANITQGTACANNGQLATDANSVGYICRNNVYVAISNLLGKLVANRQIANVTDGMTFSKDSCPGGTAWALYTPGNFIVNVTGYVSPPIEGSYFNALDQGSYWYAQALGRSPTSWYSGNDTGNIGGQLFGTFTTGCAYN